MSSVVAQLGIFRSPPNGLLTIQIEVYAFAGGGAQVDIGVPHFLWDVGSNNRWKR